MKMKVDFVRRWQKNPDKSDQKIVKKKKYISSKDHEKTADFATQKKADFSKDCEFD